MENESMTEQVNIELLKAYSMSRPGDKMTLDRPIADLLIERGVAKEIPAKPQIKLQSHVKAPK